MDLRLLIDETGRIVERRLPANEATLVCATLTARRDAILQATPPHAQPLVALRLDELKRDADAIHALKVGQPAGAQDASAPSGDPSVGAARAELDGLASDAELEDAGSLNHLLDRQVSALFGLLEGHSAGPERDPLAKAARLLSELWFSQGRAFLRLGHREQWQETKRRLDAFDADPQHAKGAELLGAGPVLARVRALQVLFGHALGIEERRPDASNAQREVRERLGSIQRGLVWLLCASNTFWPSDSPGDEAQRRLVVGPYLDALREAHGRQPSKGAAPKPDPIGPA
jgi:hypothetical protein